MGNDSKDMSGKYVTANIKYTIGMPVNRRNKNLLDVVVAVVFLLSFSCTSAVTKKARAVFNKYISCFFQEKNMGWLCN